MNNLDKNKDGIVDYDEVGERERRIMSYVAEGEFKPGSRVSISDSLKRVRGEAVSPVPLDMRFGETAVVARPEGFSAEPSGERESGGSRSGSSDRRSSGDGASDDKASRDAKALLDRYDENKNGELERDEWRRISGEPEAADYDRNGVITHDELRRRLVYRASDQYRRDQERKKPSGDPKKVDKESGARKSWRFTSAHERLPDGLPSWFKDRDADLDGQVAMHEYASSWTESKAREFAGYDRNGDGIITPDEVAK